MTLPERRCELCIFCTKQNKETGRGLCTEEHQPTNAKGEHKANVYLKYIGCHRWQKKEDNKNPPKTETTAETKDLTDKISFPANSNQPKQKRAYHRKRS